MANSDSSPSRLRSVPSKSSSVTSSKQQRKATSLPAETVEYLKAWMMSPEHIAHPYPTETEKAQIMEDTGIEMKQLTNWFVNNRKRFWKPRVEARLRDPHRAPLIKPDGSPLTLEDVIGDGPTSSSTAAPVTTTNQDRTPKRRSSRRNNTATPVVSPPRIISEQNSIASSDSSSEEEEDVIDEPQMPSTTTKTVKVHILRPNVSACDDLPELADVAMSEGTLFVPKNQVLRTFDNCALTYEEGTLESQVERIKKHYLGIYLAERNMAIRVSDDESLSVEQKPTTNKKRKAEVMSSCTTAAEMEMPTRIKIHCISPDDWKEACFAANNCYDDEALPSLEEASNLFGL